MEKDDPLEAPPVPEGRDGVSGFKVTDALSLSLEVCAGTDTSRNRDGLRIFLSPRLYIC